MKVSEYISALQALQDENGDVDVYAYQPYAPLGSVAPARPPQVKSTRAKTKREHYEKLASGYSGDKEVFDKTIVLL